MRNGGRCSCGRPTTARGALEPEDEARLAAHLDRCDDCRARLAGQRTVRRALAARPAAPAPPGLAARVLAELGSAPHWTELLAWRTWTYRLAPVAAGLLAVAFIIGRGAAASSPPAGVPEVAAAWVAGEPDAGDMPAFALLGQDGRGRRPAARSPAERRAGRAASAVGGGRRRAAFDRRQEPAP